MSKEELKFRDYLIDIFCQNEDGKRHQIIYNWRPDFLKNPKTGKNLEMDVYIGKYKCGIEYQGGVHFKDIKRYKNNSDKSRHHDLLKHELSLGNLKYPISIIEIFPQDLNGVFRTNLINRILNSIELYCKYARFEQAVYLVKMLCFTCYGIKYKNENKPIIPNDINERMRRINVLKTIYSVFRSRKDSSYLLYKLTEKNMAEYYNNWVSIDIVDSLRIRKKEAKNA